MEPTENTVRDILGQWQVSILVDFNQKYGNCVKLQTRLDRANGKSCQRQCREMASEYICGLLNGCTITAK